MYIIYKHLRERLGRSGTQQVRGTHGMACVNLERKGLDGSGETAGLCRCAPRPSKIATRGATTTPPALPGSTLTAPHHCMRRAEI